MECQTFNDLEQETILFQEWASTYPKEQLYGEWECEYENWANIYQTFSFFLDTCPFEKWNKEVIDILTYLVARDNEMMHLIDEIAKSPFRLLFFANASLFSSENDARWQVAAKLGEFPELLSEVEPILLRFITDKDEYVRRRTLLSLGYVHSPQAESVAERAWNDEDELQQYQRMAALEVLWRVNSPLLPNYLQKVKDDGREYLVAFAEKIQQADEIEHF